MSRTAALMAPPHQFTGKKLRVGELFEAAERLLIPYAANKDPATKNKQKALVKDQRIPGVATCFKIWVRIKESDDAQSRGGWVFTGQLAWRINGNRWAVSYDPELKKAAKKLQDTVELLGRKWTKSMAALTIGNMWKRRVAKRTRQLKKLQVISARSNCARSGLHPRVTSFPPTDSYSYPFGPNSGAAGSLQ